MVFLAVFAIPLSLGENLLAPLAGDSGERKSVLQVTLRNNERKKKVMK